MALIKCPECSREVSTEADACPNCGYPLRRDRPAEQDFRGWMRTRNKAGFVMSILAVIAGLAALPFNWIISVAFLGAGGLGLILHLASGTHKQF